MAINDVSLLPHKAARCDAIANLKFLGPQDPSDIISMVLFTFAMRCHLIPLVRVIMASVYGKCVKPVALFVIWHSRDENRHNQSINQSVNF